MGGDQHGPERKLQLELEPQPVRRVGNLGKQLEAANEMLLRLANRRLLRCAPTGEQPLLAGLRRIPAASQMLGDDLGEATGDLRAQGPDGVGGPQMEQLSALARDALIDRLLQQGMSEAIASGFAGPPPRDQLAGAEPGDGGGDCERGKARQLGDQIDVELAPDDRHGLHHVSVLRFLAEPRHQRTFERPRQRNLPRGHGRGGELFEIERYAVTAFDDGRPHLRREMRASSRPSSTARDSARLRRERWMG